MTMVVAGMDRQGIWMITTLVILVTLDCHHAEIVTATDMSRILSAESELSGVLSEYIAHERQRLARLEEVARDYQQHSAQGLRQPEKSIDNLVSAFVTMKRFTVDWESVARHYIETDAGTELLVQRIRQTVAQFPGRDDLDATARALMRLQDTYDLTPSAMARGHIEGMQAGSSDHLSPDDCFQLGKIAYSAEDYYHAILWIEHALQEMKNGAPAFADREDLYDHLNYAYYLEKDVRRAADLAKEWLEYNPSAERAKNNLYHYEQVLLAEAQNGTCQTPGSCSSDRTVKRNRNEWQQSQAFHNYEELCRGEEVMEITDKHRLYCSYKRSHPLFIYAPLKQEILNFEPLLFMYHDLLTDSEIAKAQELAIPKLHRSAIFRTDPGEGTKYTEHRTSKTSWIGDHEHPLIDRISEKSAALSGLTRGTVEQLQVVHYGIGGHYEPHYDFSRPGEVAGYDPAIGNRIATVIFYLASVEGGGATVFPLAGARVVPRRGSAALWYNLHRNGSVDERTLHAGCPVLTGTKWIGTKWYHEKGQEYVRTCDTDPLL